MRIAKAVVAAVGGACSALAPVLAMWKNLLAALKAGSWAPALNSLVTIAATIGLVSSDQASAVTNVIAGIVSLATLAVAAVHAFRGVQLIKAERAT